MTHTGGMAQAHGEDTTGEYVDVQFASPGVVVRFYKDEVGPVKWALLLQAFNEQLAVEAKYEGDPATLTDLAIRK